MKKRNFLFIPAIFVVTLFICCGNKRGKNDQESNKKQMLVMFYNVENLFDIYDDPEKQDDEFTPEGEKNWNETRYKEKLNHIYKVITGVGEWRMPDIIGLCEIENRQVLEDLTTKTPLEKFKYQVIHRNSHDKRRIDVVLLYRESSFRLLCTNFLTVELDTSNSRPTREILYVKGVNLNKDTLHILVNHWPSRWGGKNKTEPKRIIAAKTAKRITDSVLKTNKNAKIILTGDFNDEPFDKSLSEVVQAAQTNETINEGKLYNLSSQFVQNPKVGTHNYKGEWGVLDQFIVSSALLSDDLKTEAGIYAAKYLLKEDEKYLTNMPFRTYIGPRYQGGFSDHLPVYLKIEYN